MRRDDGLHGLPGALRDALRGQAQGFRFEMAERYRQGDDATRADILAFFESDGPGKVERAKRKIGRERRGR